MKRIYPLEDGELLPCPTCNTASWLVLYGEHYLEYSVKCELCGTEYRTSKYKNAVSAWNRMVKRERMISALK
jgi:uncharacterized protein (DUF983 family)